MYKAIIKGIYALLFLTSLSSCHAIKSATILALKKEYKENTYYYMGLQEEENKNYKKASKHFLACIKGGDGECKRKSYEEYIKLAPEKERSAIATKYFSKYKDIDAALFCVRLYFTNKEYRKIIKCTSAITSKYLKESSSGGADKKVKELKDALMYYRLYAMNKSADVRRYREELEWFLYTEAGEYHSKYYNYIRDNKDRGNKKNNLIMAISACVYTRWYTRAIEVYTSNIELVNSVILNSSYKSTVLVSALGKTLLYGNTNYTQNSVYIRKIIERLNKTASSIIDKKKTSYFYFYLARIYEKSGNDKNARENYINSYKVGKSINDFDIMDNALWYIIYMAEKKSVKDEVMAIEMASSLWHNATYFNDLFIRILPILLKDKNYEGIKRLYTVLHLYGSPLVTSQYAYVYASLIEDNLCYNTENLSTVALYKEALNNTQDLYYRIMAVYRLGKVYKRLGIKTNNEHDIVHKVGKNSESAIDEINVKEMERRAICLVDNKKVDKVNKGLWDYIIGLAEAGFYDLSYSECIKYCDRGEVLERKTSTRLSTLFYKAAKEKDKYYCLGLRLMVRGAEGGEGILELKEVELLYPAAFNKEVKKRAEEYNLSPSYIYALMRAESFFNPQVISRAGAVGLCQLMPSTAKEVARKLKIDKYSLTLPDTSIEFGVYYLSNLLSRLDSCPLLAFYSYNAGITRIKTWEKGRLNAQGEGRKVARDIMQEALPLEETRGYGKKLITGAVVYSYIYEGIGIEESVKRIVE